MAYLKAILKVTQMLEELVTSACITRIKNGIRLLTGLTLIRTVKFYIYIYLSMEVVIKNTSNYTKKYLFAFKTKRPNDY